MLSPDYDAYSEMYNFAGQNEVFEVRENGDPSHGQINRQVMLNEPIYYVFCYNPGPTLNLGGNAEWYNRR